MRDLFECLAKRLEPMKKTTRLRTVDLWNNQMEADEEGNQKKIRYDAIFMAFQVGQTRNFALNIKDRVVGVRFYFAIKNYRSNKATKDLDFFHEFVKLIDGYGEGGDSSKPIHQQIPIFSPLREAELEFDEDHELISLPWMDYVTIYKDFSAYPGLQKNRTVELTTITVNKEIDNG